MSSSKGPQVYPRIFAVFSALGAHLSACPSRVVSVPQSTKALEKAVRRRRPPVTSASSVRSVTKTLRTSGKAPVPFLKTVAESICYCI